MILPVRQLASPERAMPSGLGALSCGALLLLVLAGCGEVSGVAAPRTHTGGARSERPPAPAAPDETLLAGVPAPHPRLGRA